MTKLINGWKLPKYKGWNPDDPDPWAKDMAAMAGVDYAEGFRLFEDYDDALAYAETVDGTYTLGFDTVVDRWAVTPLSADSYGS